MKINIVEKIEDLNFNDKFNDTELTDVRLMLKNLVGKDTLLQKSISGDKVGKICIAYLIDKELCLGKDNNNFNSPCYSHVVPKNQMDKFIQQYGNIYKISNLLLNVLTDKIIVANSVNPIFVGFCPDCERTFTQESEINIDSEMNFTKQHMFKALYRYLGKEITGFNALIDFYNELKKNPFLDSRKDIDMNVLNLFFEKLNNSNIDLEIKKYIDHKIGLKSTFLDYGLYIRNHNYVCQWPAVEGYRLIEAEVPAVDLQLIGHSFVTYPIYFKDISLKSSFFITFIYDEINQKTKCYCLMPNLLYNEINRKNLITDLIKSNKKTITLLALLAFLNTNELYFTDTFKNKARGEIEKLINKVDVNKSFAEQVEFIINFINSGKYNIL